MSMAEVEVKQWGNSIGIIIPKGLARHEKIRNGDTIKIDIIKKGKLEGFGLLKGLPKHVEESGHVEF
jgi:hypothetical protein